VKRILLSPSIWFVVLLILLGVVFFICALKVEPLQAKLLGLITSPLLVVLGVAQLIKELQEEDGKEARARRKEDFRLLRRFGLLIAWLGLLMGLIYVLGFLVAIPLYIVVFLKANDTVWITSVIIAGVVTGIIYGMFEVLLERQLWRGLLNLL
jgi:hypothetical protein